MQLTANLHHTFQQMFGIMHAETDPYFFAASFRAVEAELLDSFPGLRIRQANEEVLMDRRLQWLDPAPSSDHFKWSEVFGWSEIVEQTANKPSLFCWAFYVDNMLCALATGEVESFPGCDTVLAIEKIESPPQPPSPLKGHVISCVMVVAEEVARRNSIYAVHAEGVHPDAIKKFSPEYTLQPCSIGKHNMVRRMTSGD